MGDPASQKYKNLFQLGQSSKDKATYKKCGKVVTYINHVTSSMIYHSQHFHNEKIVNTAAAVPGTAPCDELEFKGVRGQRRGFRG